MDFSNEEKGVFKGKYLRFWIIYCYINRTLQCKLIIILCSMRKKLPFCMCLLSWRNLKNSLQSGIFIYQMIVAYF